MHRLFFIIVAAFSFTWATDLIDVKIFDGSDELNVKIRKGFEYFENQVKASKEVKLSENPLIDYVLALSQHVKKNKNVAEALDYFLKTGGSFGISETLVATPYQASVLRSAAQMVLQSGNSEVTKLNQTPNTSPNSAHYQAILDAQKETISKVKGLLLDAIIEGKPSFFITTPGVAQDNKPIYFGNDFWLIGFLLGEMTDLHDRSLQNIWDFDSQKKEDAHNYIQWIFPIKTIGMGDGKKTPRITTHTIEILDRHSELLTAVQANMRKSLASMVNFWGQQLTTDNKIIPLDDHSLSKKWEENWITNTHNYLRMTRILACLRFLHMNSERDAFFGYLENVSKSEKYKKSVTNSMERFWRPEYLKK